MNVDLVVAYIIEEYLKSLAFEDKCKLKTKLHVENIALNYRKLRNTRK